MLTFTFAMQSQEYDTFMIVGETVDIKSTASHVGVLIVSNKTSDKRQGGTCHVLDCPLRP